MDHVRNILGHISVDLFLKFSFDYERIPKLDKPGFIGYRCIVCTESTLKRASIVQFKARPREVLELTNTDVSRKIAIASLGNAIYFVVLLDESSGMSSVYFLKERSEVLSALRAYKSLLEFQKSKEMWSVR